MTLDVENWPAFTPTVTAVERREEGPLRVGSQVRLTQPGQPPRLWTVTALEPQRRFAWSTRLLGMVMTGVHELEPTESGTRSVLRVELNGWASFLFGAVVRRPIARAIAQENEGFRDAAEAESPEELG